MKKLLVSLLLLGLGSAAYSQPVTNDLIIHLDAASLTGLSDGDIVSVWADSATADSVDGTIRQTGNWGEPVFTRKGFNSRPAVTFKGSDLLATSQFAMPDITGGLTMFIVATGDKSGQSGERILQIGQYGGTVGATLGIDFSTTNNGAGDEGSGGRYNGGKTLKSIDNPMTSGFHITSVQLAQGGTFNSLFFSVDDLEAVAFNNVANGTRIWSQIAANNELVVGAGKLADGTYATSDDYSGDIYEMLIYNGQLTTAEMQDVYDYLYSKYNMTVAWSPLPADGEEEFQGTVNGNVLDMTLQWNSGMDPEDPGVTNDAISDYYLYICEGEPNFVGTTPITIVASNPPAATITYDLELNYDNLYSWRVDQAIAGSNPDDPNTITGNVWQFNTLPSVPFVITDPVHQEAFPADAPVTFTAEFSSISAMTYQWYKSLDNNNDVNSSDDEPVSDATESVLIVDPAVATDGYYYCVATNKGGSTPSAPAYMTIKRQVLYMDMETADFTDASGNGNDAIVETDLAPAVTQPTLSDDVPGVIGGHSAEFVLQANGDYNRLTVPLDPYVESDPDTVEHVTYYAGYTVTLWVKADVLPQDVNTGLFNNSSAGNRDFQIELNNSRYRYNDASGTYGLEEPAAGDWTYIAVVCDGTNTTGYMNMVGDGKISATSARIEFGQFQIGTNRNTDKPFTGLIDDVKVWNYPLSFEELSAEYNAVAGGYGCMTRPEMDLNNDCTVNVLDFAEFAGDWLHCERYPEETCN